MVVRIVSTVLLYCFDFALVAINLRNGGKGYLLITITSIRVHSGCPLRIGYTPAQTAGNSEKLGGKRVTNADDEQQPSLSFSPLWNSLKLYFKSS